jgi:hypothetical protein
MFEQKDNLVQLATAKATAAVWYDGPSEVHRWPIARRAFREISGR